MTDAAITARLIEAERIEQDARTAWDEIAKDVDGVEYQAAMNVTRQAGALRRALEQWVVIRATAAHRAATTRS